ncbi:MAG: UTP--glucose-1-phosphate uridylyltransferase [Chlamydiales bacterium]|nr:UTP--glucose-1-phosphate uridylyltransferase [Chlamydiales bacterium]
MVPVTQVEANPLDLSKAEKAFEKKEVGCVILAGGMGTRLGFKGPKGCFKVPSYGQTLFEILLGKAKEMPVAVMTSPSNHAATKEALKGLHCTLFCQKEKAFLDENNQEIVGKKGPDGNGGVFEAMLEAGVFQAWKQVRYIVVIPIDNPKAMPRNLELVQTLIESGAALVVSAIESVKETGVLVCGEKQLHVVEYSEGHIKGPYAYSGMFACTIEFAKLCAKHTQELPWHLAKKVVDQKIIWKQERFIFDLFPLAKSYRIIFQPRNEYFAPIKYKEDII